MDCTLVWQASKIDCSRWLIAVVPCSLRINRKVHEPLAANGVKEFQCAVQPQSSATVCTRYMKRSTPRIRGESAWRLIVICERRFVVDAIACKEQQW